MKVFIQTKATMDEFRKKYSGIILVKIEGHEVIKNFTFTLADYEEDATVRLVIQKEEDKKIILEITGATIEAVSTLSTAQKIILALAMVPIEQAIDAINSQYESSPQVNKQYKKVEGLISEIGGNVEYSAEVHAEMDASDPGVVNNIFQILEIPS